MISKWLIGIMVALCGVSLAIAGDTRTGHFDLLEMLHTGTAFTTHIQTSSSLGANTTFVLPPTNGTNTYVLQTDGAGVTSWVAQPAALARSSSTVDGYLASTDWTTFNAKQATLSQASSSVNGYLASSDWTTFNAKQATLPRATGIADGYLASTDWTLFNGKAAAGANVDITSLKATTQIGIGSATPVAPLEVKTAVTAAVGVATGGVFASVITAAADNDKMDGLTVAPTFALAGHTGTENWGLHVKTLDGTGANGLVIDNDQTGAYALLIRKPSNNDTYWYVDQGSNQWSHGGIYADADESKIASNVAFGFANDYHSGMYQPTNPGTLAFSTNSVERMHFSSDGKIGIGTSAPVSILHIHGASTAGGVFVDTDFNGSALSLNNASGVPLTFSNGLTFHVYRGIYSSVENTNSAATPGFAFENDTQTGIFDVSASHQLGFATAGVEAMRIDGSQNLAIGTTTAVQKLTVAGLIKMAVQGAASTPACAAGTDGTLAITSLHVLCVCDGSAFVKASDGSTGCTF